jgi:opacity protein-like surface antigen
MVKKSALLLSLASAIVFASSASVAAEHSASVKSPVSGFYVGGGVGVGTMVLSSYLGTYSMSFPEVRLDGGYQFNKYVALGINVAGMFGHNLTFVPAILYVKGILPISDRFNLFAKAGVGYAHLSSNLDSYNVAVNDALGAVGIGESYQVTRSVSVGLEADLLYPLGTNWYINDYVGDAARIYIPRVMLNVTYSFGT